MFKLAKVALVAWIFVLLASGSTWAMAGDPTLAVKRTDKTLKSLLRQKVKVGSQEEKQLNVQIKRTVNAFLDFKELARLSLGKHWSQRTAKEQNEFVDVLGELIERNYVKRLRDNLNYRLEYRKQDISGEGARVLTAVKLKKDGRTEEVLIEYLMHRGKNGWMVYDVITDEVSVVRNYRSQFN
ncbi:MAG: ABC transporter substrate-binding protein, partial [Pseudomonadota bacterium]